MAENFDQWLQARANVAKKRLDTTSKAAAIDEKRDEETKGTLASAGSVVGAILGAFAGNPLMGMQLGSMGGEVLGDVATGDLGTDTLKKSTSLYDAYTKSKMK